MNFSLSTVLNTTLASGVLCALLFWVLNRKNVMGYMKTPGLIIACLLVLLRLLLPFEFFFTSTIPIDRLWFGLHIFLYNTYCRAGGFEISLVTVLFYLWMMISALLFIKLIAGYKKLWLWVDTLPSACDTKLLSILENANSYYSKPVHVRITVSGNIRSSFIMGLKNPTIVLPASLSEQDWDFVIRHELAHYYGCHLHLKMLAELLSTIYFWNPLVYLLKRQFYQLLEINADERATDSLAPDQKILYAECLLHAAISQYEDFWGKGYGIPFLNSRSSGLSQRIHMILKDSHSSAGYRHITPFFILTAVLVLASYLVILEPTYPDPTATDPHIFSLGPEDTYYRPNADGSYDVIKDEKYIATVSTIFDPEIPIKEE